MNNTEHILELDRIKEIMADYCLTDNAREQVMAMKPITYENELRAALRDTTEARMLIEKAGNPPITAMQGVEKLLAIADKGGCLSAPQLESFGVALSGIKRLKSYLKGCEKYDAGIAFYGENLDSQESVREAVNMKIRGGRVDDNATRLLRSLRGNIEQLQTKMREKADSVIRANKNYVSDSFSTMRNGHICIPVKKDCKNQISGIVMDKSSTGNTVFIEPAAVARFYEELQELMIDEENEVQRILYELTGLLADIKDIMKANQETVEKLDFIFAKGKLSLWYDGTEPSINTERYINIVNGRHPLMDAKSCVPLNFTIGNGINGVIITGPNTGGKTVAIKTVALNGMLAQSGLHVACEKGDFCMNGEYLCDIGDGQNIAENLSTFSAHITNALDILRRAGRDSLVVMDELGSGTDPAEGMGIAIAILEELKKSGALYLVTTHYPEVKGYAARTEGVVNARMEFDKESLKPMYRMIIGEAGESCAFYIAKRLGMPVDMLKRAAKAAYGSELDPELLEGAPDTMKKESAVKIRKTTRSSAVQTAAKRYRLGDSVMVYPDHTIGIVCRTADEKGVLQVQLKNKKIYINHKRIKLLVAAEEMYPADYDFSIIFETVENRKKNHQMERKYTNDVIIHEEG